MNLGNKPKDWLPPERKPEQRTVAGPDAWRRSKKKSYLKKMLRQRGEATK